MYVIDESRIVPDSILAMFVVSVDLFFGRSSGREGLVCRIVGRSNNQKLSTILSQTSDNTHYVNLLCKLVELIIGLNAERHVINRCPGGLILIYIKLMGPLIV